MQYLTSHLHSERHARCIYLLIGYFILKLHFSGVVYAVPLCAHPAAPTPGPPLAPEHPAEVVPAATAHAGTPHGAGAVTPGQRGSTQQPGHHRTVNYPLL